MTPTGDLEAANTSGVLNVNEFQPSVVQPAHCRDYALFNSRK